MSPEGEPDVATQRSRIMSDTPKEKETNPVYSTVTLLARLRG
jgi:hypothetical protein